MSRPPNILWIVTTQWRAQAFGHAGDANATTPAMDRLSAAGVNFTQAVTPHPFGPFARAALLTGTPSPDNGVRDYFDPLPAGTGTIAHDLSHRGYATAFFGKWHLSARDPGSPLVGEAHAKSTVPPGERGGFEFWEGFESGFLLNDPWLHGTRIPEPTRFGGYQSDVLALRAAEWIGGLGGAMPWFCVVSLEPPHPPYDAPASGCAGPGPGDIVLRDNVPRGDGVEERARSELSGYYAHIAATDRAVGLLVDRVMDDAVVVFTSAHGDMHGAHGLFRKGWPHEESVRVPLLVRTPGGCCLLEGRPASDATAVSLVDLRALAVAAADGRRWDLRRDFARISMPSVVRQPLQCDRIWSGLRAPGRKLVLNADGTPWLFFDLAADPGETRNLATDPSRAGEIRDLAALTPKDRH